MVSISSSIRLSNSQNVQLRVEVEFSEERRLETLKINLIMRDKTTAILQRDILTV